MWQSAGAAGPSGRVAASPFPVTGSLPMKRSHRLAALGVSLACVAAGIALVVVTSGNAQPPRDERWKKVDDAVNKGLPRTAIAELDPIIESAIKDKAYPEAIKAIAKKIGLEGNIEGNK